MHVPFGRLAIVAGVAGALLYIVQKARGQETEITLLISSAAAFVAGWVACISIPQLHKQLEDFSLRNRNRQSEKERESSQT